MDPHALRVAQDWIAERRALWERRLDALDRYLAETKPPTAKRRPRR
jgi:hypothetical protein